ncbi:LPS assembly protein LptD [Sulfurivirga sp.]|uniref:LPS-assembly protein LptD n=1 Tax=Sulfurivirga sp. TaxID=2614236 RepID=UPI0025FF6654|nr:LPS assembly protein LptD [Sulfurivirga sp.]
MQLAVILRRTALIFTAFLWLPATVGAAERCQYPWLFPPAESLPVSGPTQAWGVRLHADAHKAVLEGPVELLRPKGRLHADRAEWIRLPRQLFRAVGHVTLETPKLLLQAQELTYSRHEKIISGRNLRFQTRDRRYRGQAGHLRDERAKGQAHMRDAAITSCPVGRNDWLLHAKKLRLDRSRQRIYAHHAWLTIHDVPVLYTPYISYPTSRRGSGFLMPRLESYKSPNRTDTSWLVGIPYYFNLAPNYDDTLTFYQMQDRGTLLDNEFRLLTRQGQGTLLGGFIRDEALGRDRWRWQFKGSYRLTPALTASADWADVSDKDFFADLPLDPNLKTETHRKRTLRLEWKPNSNFSTWVAHEDWLLLRNHGYDYERRPEVGLHWTTRLTDAVDTHLNASGTDFEIPIAGHGKPEGWRYVLHPTLGGEWVEEWGSYGFKAQLKGNRYSLNDGRTPAFWVPLAEVHGQLVFERLAPEWGKGWKQTLEPRIQFSWIPRVDDQLAAPNFDSSTRSLSFDNLFVLNRFSGGDRVGDTQRLSLALTTRLLTEKGKERLRFAVGQAFWLAPRYIGLDGLKKDTTPASDYYVLGRLSSHHLFLDTTAQLRRRDISLDNLITRWRLRGRGWRWLGQLKWENVGTDSESQSLLTGAHIELGRGWSLGTFWEVNLTENRAVEQLHGLGYESCCWRGEIQVDETRLDDGRYNYAIRFVLTLKGIGSGGRRFDQQLKDKLNF